MTDTKHIVNVLTFSHSEEILTFGFKLKKAIGHSPLRQGVFSKELWNKHYRELSDINHLYCDFATANNCKYKTKDDLGKSIYCAEYY
jgi:hypothetical protein